MSYDSAQIHQTFFDKCAQMGHVLGIYTQIGYIHKYPYKLNFNQGENNNS